LLERYGFDWDGMLYEGPRSAPRAVQMNSVANHVAYEALSLVEQVRRTEGARPLATVILGCTHYPFVAEQFRKQFARLYDYRENGEFVYRHCLAKDVTLVDPAVITATQLYEFLSTNRLLAAGPAGTSEFYISVPNRANPVVETDAQGYFTYRYKYDRPAGAAEETVRVVPFSRQNIPADTLARLRTMVPSVWELIVRFNTTGPKLTALPPTDRIR
jgi:hypothetical protein